MTFDNYLMFILCVFVTLAVLFLFGIIVKLCWEEIIVPIMDRIKYKDDRYWMTEWEEENKEKRQYMRALAKLGLTLHDVDCMIPEYIVRFDREQQSDMDGDEGMIKFRVDLAKWHKEE